MVVWKNCILLFGGFYEAYKDTRYFNDLWLFDMRERKWNKLESSKGKGGGGGGGGGGSSVGTQWPSQRGGMCFFAPAGANPRNTFYVYGGYSLASGKKSVKGTFHRDLWQLRLTPGGSGKGGSLNVRDLRVQWEQLPLKGSAPSTRSSMSVAVHKNRAVCFGGVVDEDGKDDLSSRFFNDIHAFDMDKKRWFELKLRSKDKAKGKRRKKKKNKKKGEAQQGGGDGGGDNDDENDDEDDDSGDDDEEEEYNTLGYDDLDDNKFYYMVDGELVEMDIDSDDEEGEEGENKGAEDEDAGEDKAAAQHAAVAEETQRLRKEEEEALAAAEAKAEADAEAAREAARQKAEEEAAAEAEAAAQAAEEAAAQALEMLRLEARENAKVTPRPRMSAGLAVRAHSLYVFGGALGEVKTIAAMHLQRPKTQKTAPPPPPPHIQTHRQAASRSGARKSRSTTSGASTCIAWTSGSRCWATPRPSCSKS